MLNGLRGSGGGNGGGMASSSSSSGGGGGVGGVGGTSNEVKYPSNCATRISLENNAAASVAAADGAIDPAVLDKLYEPKPDKKVMRVITVIGYIFTVSMVAILLSLYYLVRV